MVLQLEIPLETVMAAAKLARSLGKVVILDPAPAPGPLPGELLALCDYLKPNETELALLTGLPTATVEQCEMAARQLLAQGVGHGAGVFGGQRALAVTPQEALLVARPRSRRWIPPPPGTASPPPLPCAWWRGRQACKPPWNLPTPLRHSPPPGQGPRPPSPPGMRWRRCLPPGKTESPHSLPR